MNNQSEITENRQTVDSQTSSDHKVGLATAEKQTEASYNHRHRKSAPTSVATAVFFITRSGVFSLWSIFRNECCITVFSIQEYSSFTGVMCRVSSQYS